MLGEPVVSRRERARGGRCATPGCPLEAHAAGRFCAEHAAFYARLRDEITVEMQAWRSSSKRGHKQRPTCCSPECFETRDPGRQFCWEHETEAQEDDA